MAQSDFTRRRRSQLEDDTDLRPRRGPLQLALHELSLCFYFVTLNHSL